MDKRKILYSPGFGAGWSSWCGGNRELEMFMLTYQPIIEFLEAGNVFQNIGFQQDDSNLHPILKKFLETCKERWGTEPYLGGAHQLKVGIVKGRFRIREYDGFESIENKSDIEWY